MTHVNATTAYDPALTVHTEDVDVPGSVDVTVELFCAGEDVDRLEKFFVVVESVERVHQVAVLLRRYATQ